LNSFGYFSDDFLDYLSTLKFAGNVMAIPEGTLFFKDEPILEVTAPIIEGQLVETMVINAINLQVGIATKASRCVHSAKSRSLVDFSLRRTQGTDAGLKVARTTYLAGFKGTSNVLAAQRYGIPASGTMAHSFITCFKEEIDAFRAFADTFPDNTVLLIDTYDTVTGAQKAMEVAEEMAAEGKKLKGVRLDSGDMAALSKEVRGVFRHGGFNDVQIFASGGFDEFKIATVLENSAEIDAFGIGTKIGVSADGPYTDMTYKLVQYDGRLVLKLSSGKKTLVSEKQVYRTKANHWLVKDTIALRDEALDGTPLLETVMENGKRQKVPESLSALRERFREKFAELDDSYKAITDPKQFPVELSPGLEKLQERIIQEVREKELGES
jgi:nicotinate phosphoribosyltransferase